MKLVVFILQLSPHMQEKCENWLRFDRIIAEFPSAIFWGTLQFLKTTFNILLFILRCCCFHFSSLVI